MRFIRYILVFYCINAFPQQSYTIELLDKLTLDVDDLVEIDHFETLYYNQNNTFFKKSPTHLLNYSNIQYGKITSSDPFNPLKINLFYSEFNSVVILDNRLAEISRIDFNTIQPFRNITQCSSGNDNTIWIYNQNTQQLELFDYVLNKTRVKTLPIDDDVIQLESNYNHCWVLTNEYILKYNYTGSLLEKIEVAGCEQIESDNGNLFLLKDNRLFVQPKFTNEIIPLNHPELLINRFLVTNETLYIYNGEMLHRYRLKTN